MMYLLLNANPGLRQRLEAGFACAFGQVQIRTSNRNSLLGEGTLLSCLIGGLFSASFAEQFTPLPILTVIFNRALSLHALFSLKIIRKLNFSTCLNSGWDNERPSLA